MADLNLRVKVAVQGANQLRNLGGDLSNVGKGLTIGVTAPLIAAGAGLISMAADAEKAQAKVDSVFESMGASAFTSIEALNAHAEAMARTTTFDDDAIKEAQATLLTFGNITGDSFTRATEAAADMTQFFDGDLQAASIQLGKALNDPIAGLGALSRIGVQFTDEQKAMIETMVAAGDTAGAQGIILAEVERQLGSVAEDLAATSSGQMAQAMNQLGEAGESMGTLLLPVLVNLAGILKGLAGWFNALSPEMKGFIVTLASVAAAVGPVLFVGGKLVSSFQAIGSAFNALKFLLLTNPFIALAAAAIALVALIVLNWDKIVEVFEGALRFISDTGKKLWTPLSKGFGAAIDFIRGVWNAFATWWNSIELSVPSIDVPFVGKVGGFSIGLPDLPLLAEGGIVNQPTLAVIGERGPEAVVPLSRGGLASETHIHLTVMGDLKAEERTLPSILSRAVFASGLTEPV